MDAFTLLALLDGKKKGAKGKKKKDKRGKRDKWGKKKKKDPPKPPPPPPPVVEERPPTPPTIAYIDKFYFECEKDFFDHMIENKVKKPTYVLFCFREKDYERDIFDEEDVNEVEEIVDKENTRILEVEEWIELCLFGMEQHHLSVDICYMVVQITPKQFSNCQAFNHPVAKLKMLPTLMRWGSSMRLEGEECLSEDFLYLFFSREIQRNGQRYVDDGSVNPFYTPPPPEPTPPPTPPPPIPKKKEKKKDKKGKKGKKGKKEKGKKGKGKGKGKKEKGKKK